MTNRPEQEPPLTHLDLDQERVLGRRTPYVPRLFLPPAPEKATLMLGMKETLHTVALTKTANLLTFGAQAIVTTSALSTLGVMITHPAPAALVPFPHPL